MWFATAILQLSALSFVNSALLTYIAYKLNLPSQIYGIIASSWSVVFIVSNYVFGPLSKSGNNKLLAVISLISSIISAVLFELGTQLSISLSFIINAITSSSANLALTTTVFEFSDSNEWAKKSILQNMMNYVLKGILLISVGIFPMISLKSLIYSTVVLALLSFIFIPEITINFERKLHSFMQGLSWVNFYTGFPNRFEGISVGMYNSNRYGLISLKKRTPLSILLGIMFGGLVGSYILTALPILVKNQVSMHNMWLANGVANIIMGIALLMLTSTASKSLALAIITIILRAFWFIFMLPLAYDANLLPIYITVPLVLYSILNSVMYNIFSETTSGMESHSYFIMREMGNLTGSLLAGFVLSLSGSGWVFFVVPVASTVISLFSILFL